MVCGHGGGRPQLLLGARAWLLQHSPYQYSNFHFRQIGKASAETAEARPDRLAIAGFEKWHADVY